MNKSNKNKNNDNDIVSCCVNKLAFNFNIKILVLLTSQIFIFGFTNLHAKDNLKFQPSLSVGLGFSDNIEQDVTNKKSTAIAEISPALTINHQGGRIKTNVDYRLNSFSYSNKDLNKSNTIDHNLKSALKAELLDNSLFLNIDATITQELLDKTQNDDSNSLTGVNNLTQTYSFGINPYWEQKWGRYVSSNISFNHNQLIYDKDNVSLTALSTNDSEQNSVNATLTSGSIFKKFTWSLTGSHSETKYENTLQVSKVSSANSHINYDIYKDISLIADLGYEKYNQDIDDNDNDAQNDNGIQSKVGFVWSPSPKNSLSASYGKRFYDNTYDFSFKHQGDRIKFELGYNENVTSTRDQLRNDNLNLQNDQFNQENTLTEIEDSLIEQAQLSSTNQALDDLYISKKATMGIVYQLKNYSLNLNLYQEEKIVSSLSQREDTYGGKLSATIKRRKSSYAFSVNYEDRTSSLTTQDGSNYGADASWNIKLGKRMDATTSVTWSTQKNSQVGVKNESDNLTINWKLNRKLNRNLTADLTLKHQQKMSTISTEEFKENSVFLNLSQKF